MQQALDEYRKGNKQRIGGLDGLRALGVFMVVAGHLHAFGYINSQEIWGNYIFFLLSGFVSVEPWNRDTERKFLSFSYITQFYVKRFMRIMPLMLCATVLQALIEPGTILLNNLLFINPYYVSWFIKNIVIYYLLVPPIMVFLHGLRKFLHIQEGGEHWIALILFLAAIAGCRFALSGIIIASNGLGPFRLGYILFGCAAGYLCKSVRAGSWMRKQWVQNVSGILCTVCVLLVLFCTPLVKSLALTHRVSAVIWGEGIVILITLTLIIGTYFSSSGPYYKIMTIKPIAYIGKQSLTILLVHIPLMHFFPYSGKLQIALVMAGSVSLAVLFDMAVEKPCSRFTKYLCSRIESDKMACVLVFAVLACYVLTAVSLAHSKFYTLGDKVGLSVEDALGLKYTSGLSSPFAGGTWVEGDTVDFEFELNSIPQNDLIFTLGVLEVKDTERSMTVRVNGTDIEEAELTKASIIRIPQASLQGRRINIECHFSEGSSYPAQLSFVRLSEEKKYTLGTELSFAQNRQTANAYFSYGLKTAESTATWAVESARLELPMENPEMRELDLTLNWAAVDSHAQRMIVSCNGVELLNHQFLNETGTVIHIPKECAASENLILDFAFPDACPCSFAFSSMKIEPRQTYTLGTELTFTADEPTANSYFTYGLGVAEERATWAKDTAQASFLLNDSQEELTVTLNWLAMDSHAQRMIVSCNGAVLLDRKFLEETSADIHIPKECAMSEVLTLDFSFPDACPSSFALSTMSIHAS